MAGRMGARLMAIVTEGDRGRIYLDPTQDHGSQVAQTKQNRSGIPKTEPMNRRHPQLS